MRKKFDQSSEEPIGEGLLLNQRTGEGDYTEKNSDRPFPPPEQSYYPKREELDKDKRENCGPVSMVPPVPFQYEVDEKEEKLIPLRILKFFQKLAENLLLQVSKHKNDKMMFGNSIKFSKQQLEVDVEEILREVEGGRGRGEVRGDKKWNSGAMIVESLGTLALLATKWNKMINEANYDQMKNGIAFDDGMGNDSRFTG
ncbi:hypothetical protein Tco_1042168 [Tanacetum coccineum]|uniref:Uncharacterized protein n=1 Tax=Tanacetum coccineum TaxID=301880 RepID=A0ABQ5GKX5_9ASTR